MAWLLTFVLSAIESITAWLTTASLILISTDSICCFSTTVALYVGNNYLARRTCSRVTIHGAWMCTLSSSLSTALLPTTVRFDVHVWFRIFNFPTKAVIVRHGLLVRILAMWASPGEYPTFVHVLRVKLLQIVLLANPILDAFEMASDSTFLAIPDSGCGRAL